MIKRKRNIKAIIYIFIAIFIFIGILFSFYYYKFISEPYDYIIKGNKDNMYKRIYRLDKILDSLDFNNLMIRLIDTSNRDLLSVEIATQYAYDEKMCYLIPLIEQEYKFLNSLPIDTSWNVQIRQRHYRESGIKDARIMRSLPIYLKELKIECKKKNEIQ